MKYDKRQRIKELRCDPMTKIKHPKDNRPKDKDEWPWPGEPAEGKSTSSVPCGDL